MKSTIGIIIFLVSVFGNSYSYTQCTPLVFDPLDPIHTTTTGSPMVLNVKTDFCAAGDGVTDDHQAFRDAAAFISARGGYAILIIPDGVYRVGRQNLGGGGYYAQGENVMNLQNCSNVEILAFSNAKLLYNDNLKLGYFDPGTGLPFTPTTTTELEDKSRQALIGSCIYLNNSHNFKISNLTIDGNCYDGKVIKGGFGSSGNQLVHFGIRCGDSRNLVIENCQLNRMGLDGMYIRNSYADMKNVQIINSSFDFNSRQGISIVNGDSITIVNSKFYNTRMGYVQSSPGAGIDLEPNYSYERIKNVLIENCLFENNFVGLSLVGDNTVSGNENITINNSTFAGSTYRTYTYALKLREFRKVTFTNCFIYGEVLDRGNLTNVTSFAEGVKFTDCLFSDCYRGLKIDYPNFCAEDTFYTCKQVTDTIRFNSDNRANYEGVNLAYLTIENSTFETFNRTNQVWNLSAQTGKKSKVSGCTVYKMQHVNVQPVWEDINMVLNNNYYYHYASSIPASHDATTDLTGYNITTYWSDSIPPPTCIPDTVSCSDSSTYEYAAMISKYEAAPSAEMTDKADPVIVFPNPSDSKEFFIENKGNDPLRYEIFDNMGKKIDAGNMQAQMKVLKSYPHLPSGIYFISFWNKLDQGRQYRSIKVVLK